MCIRIACAYVTVYWASQLILLFLGVDADSDSNDVCADDRYDYLGVWLGLRGVRGRLLRLDARHLVYFTLLFLRALVLIILCFEIFSRVVFGRLRAHVYQYFEISFQYTFIHA